MGYEYKVERPSVFTEEGVRNLLHVRDQAFAAIKIAGVVNMQKAVTGLTGSSWEHLALVDFLVEIGDLHEVRQAQASAGQYRLFTRPCR